MTNQSRLTVAGVLSFLLVVAGMLRAANLQISLDMFPWFELAVTVIGVIMIFLISESLD